MYIVLLHAMRTQANEALQSMLSGLLMERSFPVKDTSMEVMCRQCSIDMQFR